MQRNELKPKQNDLKKFFEDEEIKLLGEGQKVKRHELATKFDRKSEILSKLFLNFEDEV